MNKVVSVIFAVAASLACFADGTLPVLERNVNGGYGRRKIAVADSFRNVPTNQTPRIVKTVRSPLGKEIDALKESVAKFNGQTYFMMKQAAVGVTANHEFITNLLARVEKLEAAEAERVKRSQAAREAAKKRAEERKAGRQEKASARETLQGVIRRGQKAAKREGK